MNKGMFRGWKTVFGFTFKQGVDNKSYKTTTFGIMLGLFLVSIAVSFYMAYGQKKDMKPSAVEKVYIINDTQLTEFYFDGFLKEHGTSYPKISFEVTDKTLEELNENIQSRLIHTPEDDTEINEVGDIVLHIFEEANVYKMCLYVPEDSAVGKSAGKKFLKDAELIMEQTKLLCSGIDLEDQKIVMGEISSTILEAGEGEKSVGEEVAAMVFPMASILFIYLMTLLYGQNVGYIVSVEKSSKLMEMMLTITQPYSLILGKILGITLTAILQMILWITALVTGFLSGNYLAKVFLYPEYTNEILQVIELLRQQEGSDAFSWRAFILAFLTICLAFLFYCILAGMCASFATKAENLSQVMSIYMMVVLAGFFGAYMVPLKENETLSTLMRLIPITSAFLLPGDLVVGNISVMQGVLYVSVLLVTTLILVVIAGRVYRNQLFYKGTSFRKRFKKK